MKMLWNGSPDFRGEFALTASLVNGSDHVEVSSAADHKSVFIRRAGDSTGDFHIGTARALAAIHAIAGDLHTRNGRRRFPVERNPVRRRAFVATGEAGAE